MTDTMCISAKFKEKHEKLGEKQHRVVIALRVKKRLLLLVLGLMPLLIEDISEALRLISAASFEITLLLVTLINAILERENHRLLIEKRQVLLQRGILNKTQTCIAANMISSVSIIKTPLLSIFGAVRLRAGTAAKAKDHFDFCVSNDKASRALRSVAKLSKDSLSFKASRMSVLLNAISVTNMISGLLFLAPVLLNMKKIINDDLDLSIIGQFAGCFAQYLPYGIAFLAAVALMGWTAEFIRNCFMTGCLSLAADKNHIISAMGVVSRKLECVKRENVLCYDEKQTLLMRTLRRKTLCFSYERSEHLLIPALESHEFERIKRNLLPPEMKSAIKVVVPEKGRRGWWMPWALWLIAALGVTIRFCVIFDIAIVLSAATPAVFVLFWKMTVCMTGAREAYISAGGRYVSVCAMQKMTVHNCTALQGNVEMAVLTVNPFQQQNGLCTVKMKIRGHKGTLKCKNMPKERAQAIIDMIRSI